ncbi:MAG: hypothetical protein ABIK62_05595, partial [candidate division WOR-3 bacterium]
ARLRRAVEVVNLDKYSSIWVADMGWGSPIVREFERAGRQLPFRDHAAFGRNIVVFRVPTQGIGRWEELALDALLGQGAALTGRLPGRLTSALWPSDYPADSISRLLAGRIDLVVPYADFYRMLQADLEGLDRFLPALAFWAVGTPERHVIGLSSMNDLESYLAGGFRFTLLGVDQDTLAAVYVMDRARDFEPNLRP